MEMPKRLMNEMARLARVDLSTLSPLERDHHDRKEDRLDGQIQLWNATIARQQQNEMELVLRNDIEGYLKLRELHAFCRAVHC